MTASYRAIARQPRSRASREARLTKALGAGAHSIGILVTTVEGDVVNSDAIEVLLR